MTGSVLDQDHICHPRIPNEDIKHVRDSCLRSPKKSIRSAGRERQMPQSTVQKLLYRHLRLYAYKVQLLQAITPKDRPRRKEFTVGMLDRLSGDSEFLAHEREGVNF